MLFLTVSALRSDSTSSLVSWSSRPSNEYDALVLVASEQQVSCSSVPTMRVRNELSLDVVVPLAS